MCNKAVDAYASVIQFAPECYKTQEMCVEAADICPFVFNSALDRYMVQEMRDKVVSEDPFMLKYCPDRYKTQEISGKAIDAFLLKLSGLFRKKMIKKLDDAVFPNDDIVFVNEYSGNVTFSSDKIGILSVDLTDINPDNVNFDNNGHPLRWWDWCIPEDEKKINKTIFD